MAVDWSLVLVAGITGAAGAIPVVLGYLSDRRRDRLEAATAAREAEAARTAQIRSTILEVLDLAAPFQIVGAAPGSAEPMWELQAALTRATAVLPDNIAAVCATWAEDLGGYVLSSMGRHRVEFVRASRQWFDAPGA